MVPDLARALGPDHEVVLHDLRLIPNSIIAIGGTLTGRAVGGPTTDLLLRLVRQGRSDDVLRYRTRSADGRILRSSTLFIRDPDGRPVGCLCMNTDITDWLNAKALVDGVTKVSPLESSEDDAAAVGGEDGAAPLGDDGEARRSDLDQAKELEGGEHFAPSVDELAVSLVRQAIENVGVPIELMQKPHKLKVVRELETRGLFLLRDAVNLTAQTLAISRYSVYNYLKELQADSPPENGSPLQQRGRRRRLPLAREEEVSTEEVRDGK
jgi:predicted transcriptional regulator YheO